MSSLTKKRNTPTTADAPVSRLSIAETIARDLRRDILGAVIPPGQPIRQDHIARTYGVSQAPVREALRQLASENLVSYEVNCGVKVPALAPQEALEIGALLAKLEPEFIAPAAKAFTAADYEKAKTALKKISQASSVPDLLQAKEDFHEAIFVPAALPVTLQIVRQLRRRYARYLGFMWQHGGNPRASRKEHRDLPDLISDGQVRQARDLLKSHIERTTETLAKSLARYQL
ncbi:MAG: GntR family transcriptional regulator [Rhodospirillaceae bacterium]